MLSSPEGLLELSTREVKLLLKYGYPFDEQEKTLRSSRAAKGYHRVRLGAYWIEMMVADLVRSAKDCAVPRYSRRSTPCAMCWRTHCRIAPRSFWWHWSDYVGDRLPAPDADSRTDTVILLVDPDHLGLWPVVVCVRASYWHLTVRPRRDRIVGEVFRSI